MADVEKATIKKLGTLFQALREQQARGYELLEEIGKVLDGGPGIGDTMKRLEHTLSQIWAARYGSPYLWNYKQDRPQIKRLLRTLSPEDIGTRWATYVRDGDAFYVRARHGFGLFSSQVNRFAGEPVRELELEADAPADCKHTPRCQSDQEHTRRKSNEMRQ